MRSTIWVTNNEAIIAGLGWEGSSRLLPFAFSLLPNVNIYNIRLIRTNMPAITASLSEIGYEGYVSIPKGMRSKVIDKMLRDYALKKTMIYREQVGQMSVQQVLDQREQDLTSLKTLQQENKLLREAARQ